MNIPPNYGSGSQPNDLISTTRLIPPLPDIEGKNDAWSWSHIYPHYSIMLIRTGNKDITDANGTYIPKLVYLHDAEYNTKVIGYNIQVVNAILAKEFIALINKNYENPVNIDYTQYVDISLKMIKEWSVGGIIGTPPSQKMDTNYITRERYIVTHVRGHQFCENIWGTGIYGGDYAFIMGKMCPFDSLIAPGKNIIYNIGNGQQITVSLPKNALNQIHYIPQFVAVSYKQPTIPVEALCFNVTNGTKTVYEMGIPRLIGRCDQNKDFYEQYEPFHSKRVRQDIDAIDMQLIKPIVSPPLTDMQEVIARQTIYMNYMTSV